MRPKSSISGASSRARSAASKSAASCSEDRAGAIGERARMARGIHGETAARARLPALGEDGLGLRREGPQAIGGGPKADRGLRRVRLALYQTRPHDDHVPLGRLVKSHAELSD